MHGFAYPTPHPPYTFPPPLHNFIVVTMKRGGEKEETAGRSQLEGDREAPPHGFALC